MCCSAKSLESSADENILLQSRFPDALVRKYMDEYKADRTCASACKTTSQTYICTTAFIKTSKGPKGQERLVRMKYPCGATYEFEGPRGSERPISVYKMGDNFIVRLDMSNIHFNHSQGGINARDAIWQLRAFFLFPGL